MPLMRNIFRSKPNDQIQDENARPRTGDTKDSLHRTDTWNSAKSGSIGTSSSGRSENRPTEYKLSEISDGGVYLPPSPAETKSSFWSTKSGASTRTSSHRSVLNECEPFSISRESFDSYRRSFDISARSPVIDASPVRPRQSLDARQLRLPPTALAGSPNAKPGKQSPLLDQTSRRPSATPFQPRPNILPDNHVNPPSAEPEESEDVGRQGSQALPGIDEVPKERDTSVDATADRFEDVGLGEPADAAPSFKKTHQPQQQSKKSSIFARFGGPSTSDTTPGLPSTSDPVAPGRPASTGLGIGLGMFGRKRGGSGQGAELASVQGHQQRPGGQSQSQQHGHAKRDSFASITLPESKNKIDPQ